MPPIASTGGPVEAEDYWVDDGFDWACTHCGGEGTCDEGADPLLTCPETPHPCHACKGTGNRRDQVIF